MFLGSIQRRKVSSREFPNYCTLAKWGWSSVRKFILALWKSILHFRNGQCETEGWICSHGFFFCVYFGVFGSFFKTLVLLQGLNKTGKTVSARCPSPHFRNTILFDTVAAFLSHAAWDGLCDVTEHFLEFLFIGTLFSLASSHLENIRIHY